jgi:hypothetical protein
MAARYNYTLVYNNYTAEGEVKLQEWLKENCKYAIYGHEIAPTTGTPHLQGYISLDKKKTMKTIHNQLEKLGIKLALKNADKSAESNKRYCSKDGKDIFEHGEINITGHKPRQADIDYKEAMEAPTVAAAMAIIREKRPRDFCLHSEQIERSIRKIKPEAYKHIYELGMFKAPPLIWTNKAILLWGTTNTGKTQFALANFKNPLLVRHLDKLAELSSDNDGIVFDDVDLKNRPPNSIIHLLDWECPADVHIRYKIAHIPAQMKKVFTSNTENPFYEECIDAEIKAAIERRLEKHEINLNLYYPLFNICEASQRRQPGRRAE